MLIEPDILPKTVKEAHSKVPVSDWKNKILHRDGDLPAIIYHSGRMEWFIDGLHHRDNDLPAVILVKGENKQKWYNNGVLHRDNDLPATVEKNRQRWFKKGLRHRDKGPADIFQGSNVWYWKNRLHRFDGPCIEYPYLPKTNEYQIVYNEDRKIWFFPHSLFPWVNACCQE